MNMKKTLKEEIYNEIFNDITEGIYKANDILTESGLSEKYNVSKAPVREALIELCKDNVLNSLPRLGYQVVPITLKEVLDILEFRLDLEICALRKAVPFINEESIQLLRKAEIFSGNDEEQNVLPHWLRNQRFHLELCKLSGNEYSYKILKETLKQSSRYVSQYFHAAWQRDSESKGRYHAEVIDALEKGDFDLAYQMLTKDIMAVKEEIQQIHSFN